MNDAVKHKPLAFSGIQPSGKLHLGNYLGAMKNWVRLQDRMPCIYCVVDMHAITVWQEPAELAASTREVTAACMAVGIDPVRSILFNQSQARVHAELAWVFNCVARIGWLNRMTQFKDKAGNKRELKDRPEAENLINIYAALADHTPETVIAEYAGAQFSTFKNALADLAVAKLTPIAGEMRKLLADPSGIDATLKCGTERALEIALPIMSEVRRLVGFVG